jgi:hypothetical protein
LKDKETLRREQELRDKLASLRAQPAHYEDMKKVVLRRSKIEEWFDEPFFEKTMKNVFVRVGFSQKYIIA